MAAELATDGKLRARLIKLLKGRSTTFEQRLKDLGATETRRKSRGYAPPFPNPGPVTPTKTRSR